MAAVVETEEYNPWIASFNVGNSFGARGGFENDVLDTRINRAVALGGQIAYVWNASNVGVEFLADWAPVFKFPHVGDVAFSPLDEHPSVSAYMFNAIYGIPVGHLGNFRPYISGGIGAMNMHADLLQIDTNLLETTISASQTRFAGNIGVGGLGYVGKVGVRADIRWFRATKDSSILGLELLDDADRLIELSGLKYWRSSLGVAFRW